MATEQRSEYERQEEVVVPTNSQEIVPVEAKGPMLPRGITDEEVQVLKARAANLVSELGDASGGRELELNDSITSLGVQAQRTAGNELDLLRSRVGAMLTQDGAGEEISKDLVNLRLTLNQITPREIQQATGVRGFFIKIPLVGRFTPAVKVLEKIAIRYEPVCKQVQVIETKLRDGRAMLGRDNVELRKLYEQVEVQQLPIQKNAYMGELVMQQLIDLAQGTDDTLKKDRVQSALHDVAMRVQDLRTMEEVHTQFFVSIEMIRQNNNRLGQSVERTLALGTNVVIIGLALQSALTREKRVLVATQRTREFLGNLIVANAASIKQHTAEIGDIYNSPIIAIDKITQAHNDLIEAMNIADRLKEEGIASARESIARLSQLSADLQQRSGSLRERVEAEPRSIEA